jgi:putative transposase
MPRANKYILPGYAYHLTHRCHNRQWLLRYALDRDEYRRRLRQTLRETGVSLLSYCLTSNHVHLLVASNREGDVPQLMQKQEGEFAEWYNRRKQRSGAFWNGRYQCTMVEGGEHLWRCMSYIDLNMVRAGKVVHPRDWRWCGYDELTGRRSKFLVLDRKKVLELTEAGEAGELRRNHDALIAEALAARRLERESEWTEAIGVGSEEFVAEIAGRTRQRATLEMYETDSGVWAVREAEPTEGYCAGLPVQERGR